MMTLNICWLSSRKNGMFQWFCDSIQRETGGNYQGIRIIVVDYHCQAPIFKEYEWTDQDANKRIYELRRMCQAIDVVVTPPKPCAWQGPWRLTRNNYFAAANARNTALCYCLDGYAAFVDDLSILMPGWLKAVREHQLKGQIVCGAFRKVNKMVVENGRLVSFEDHPSGHDSRWQHGDEGKAVKCAPQWLFGCSFGSPIEALLQVNGSCEDLDSTGLGMEDAHLGIALGNNRFGLYYDLRMLTYESEEHHHIETPMLRLDKNRQGESVKLKYGVDHPVEKGHAAVRMLATVKRFSNYFGEEGIAGLRKKILRGESFPTGVLPCHDWYDSQPLIDL